MSSQKVSDWVKNVVKQDEIDKYLDNGKDFIDEKKIWEQIKNNENPSPERIRNIIKKSLSLEPLTPEETASLIHCTDEKLWEEIYTAAQTIKKTVYDNRIVFFAPLYCSNLCVNNCAYCGFREANSEEVRRILSMDEVKRETAAVINEGHKRMIVVYGEHPQSDADYIADTIKEIYSVKLKTRNGYGSIRRVNVNAAPMSIEDLKKLWKAGIGTYQVFQETYHKETYNRVHPKNTIKGNFDWRLYSLHRAMDAGIDDVAIGALFGLYDWRFEVMGLVYHAADLKEKFGVGPHTVSFPRMTKASGSDLSTSSEYLVPDEDFKKIVAILRLAVPYAGLIITAREKHELRKEVIRDCGCTQTDASTKIGIGSYSEQNDTEVHNKEQFEICDSNDLDSMIKELAEMGFISSFCTAGYRCGRTGEKIMGLLTECVEGKFCKLNAILTFKEYLDDFASEETKKVGEKLMLKEIQEVRKIPFYKEHNLLKTFEKYYQRIVNGERDVYI